MWGVYDKSRIECISIHKCLQYRVRKSGGNEMKRSFSPVNSVTIWFNWSCLCGKRWFDPEFRTAWFDVRFLRSDNCRCIVISGSVLLKDGESREEKWEGSPYSSYQMFWEVLGTLLNEEYKSVGLKREVNMKGIEVRAMTNTELLVFRPRRSLTEEGRKVLNMLVTSELVRLQHLLQSSTLL